MPAPTYRATVERIDSLAYNVRMFRCKLVEPSELPFQAGQFVIVNVPKDGGVVKRAYSIASPPHESGAIELCIQHVEGGVASTYFWKLKEGDPLSLSGPHGNFLLKQPLDYDPVFVATGTGVAPLRGMIKHLIHENCSRNIWLFFGCRYEHAILYQSEFRSLAAARPNFHYIPTVSRPKEWRGATGHVQQIFQQHITRLDDKEIYLCGWLEVVKAICQDLEGFGVPKEKLHYEEWG
jgi:NAD(P)H-flavin reductase